jgi:hypothetical protein
VIPGWFRGGSGVVPGVVPGLGVTQPIKIYWLGAAFIGKDSSTMLSSLPQISSRVSLKTPKAPRQCQVLARCRRRAPRSPRSAGKWRAMAGARIR